MAPQPKIGENGENELKPNGKPETTRGDDRLVVSITVRIIITRLS